MLSCAIGELSGNAFLVNVVGLASPKLVLHAGPTSGLVKYSSCVGLLNGARANQASAAVPKIPIEYLVVP
jgi:hypothetical protein